MDREAGCYLAVAVITLLSSIQLSWANFVRAHAMGGTSGSATTTAATTSTTAAADSTQHQRDRV